MNYTDFEQILNKTIFEKSKAELLQKIADSSERYIGLFRPTNPKAKLVQNLLQSHEIRFGGALEKVIENYLQIKGCEILPKTYTTTNGDGLNIDQCFRKENKVFIIEQKVRDDHDSTKKRGQLENFKKKLDMMLSTYSKFEIVGIIYFIDPKFTKNKNYYSVELNKLSTKYSVETKIFYGENLFDYLGYPEIWDEISSYLTKWKLQIPEFPEINLDLEAHHTFEEIKDLPLPIFNKLLKNDEVFQEIITTLFPDKATLKLLYNYFLNKQDKEYQKLATKLAEKIGK